jgi:hypothetical protein
MIDFSAVFLQIKRRGIDVGENDEDDSPVGESFGCRIFNSGIG